MNSKNLLRILSVTALILDASGSMAQCKRYFFDDPPSWVGSASASLDGSQLVIVDAMRDALLIYGANGKSLKPPVDAAKVGRTNFKPVAMSAAGSDYFVELVDGSIIKVDENIANPVPVVSPQLKANPEGFRVGSLYQWEAAGKSLIAYGTLRSGAKREYAFMRVPTDGLSSSPEKLLTVNRSDYYLIGYPYIASVGSTAFFALIEKGAIQLYKAGSRGAAEAIPLKIPYELRNVPSFLTPLNGPDDAPARFAELEKFTVVAGLYAQGDDLYLLARRHVGKAGTIWTLYGIDLTNGRLERGMRLPTTANHLTVAPSKDSWYFIERGPVLLGQTQRNPSFLVIPNEDIRAHKLISSCDTPQ